MVYKKGHPAVGEETGDAAVTDTQKVETMPSAFPHMAKILSFKVCPERGRFQPGIHRGRVGAKKLRYGDFEKMTHRGRGGFLQLEKRASKLQELWPEAKGTKQPSINEFLSKNTNSDFSIRIDVRLPAGEFEPIYREEAKQRQREAGEPNPQKRSCINDAEPGGLSRQFMARDAAVSENSIQAFFDTYIAAIISPCPLFETKWEIFPTLSSRSESQSRKREVQHNFWRRRQNSIFEAIRAREVEPSSPEGISLLVAVDDLF